MSLDEKIKTEYLLLRNYQMFSLSTRGVLLQMDFDALEKIATNNWFIVFQNNDPDKEKGIKTAQSMIQVDIISKIMMYVEDLIIISESLRNGKAYYELLNQETAPENKDVGTIIEEFLNNIDIFTNSEISKIMGYVDLDDLVDIPEFELIKKHIENNILQIRILLKTIGEFGIQHHSLFRRFKHAGLSMMIGLPFKPPVPDYLKPFEHHIMIHSDSSDPLNNMRMIPYNQNAVEGYKIIIHAIQRLLQDMITSRIACIQRNVNGIIPIEFYYDLSIHSDDELKLLQNAMSKFLKDRPAINTNFEYNLDAKYTKNSIAWYLDLPQFLMKCTRMKNESLINQKKLNGLKSK